MAMYRCGSNSGGVTPTSITPSNATPAAMSSGEIYQTTAAGYAIESYDSKTPDDTTPPSVSSGDIVKMGGPGYLYETQQTGGALTLVEAVSNVPNAATFTIGQSLTVGKTYHLLITNAAASAANAKTATEISVSSGASNLTAVNDVSGFLGSNAYYSSLIYYTFVATSQTVSFSKSANARRSGYILFEV